MTVVLDITGRCNASCRFCFGQKLKKNQIAPDMTLDDANNGLEFMKKMLGRFSVRISGTGDPLLNSDFIHILNKSCTMTDFVSVNTNGIALDKDMSNKILETNISLIKISITGFDYKTYNMFQGYGSTNDKLRNKVYSNVEYLLNKRNATRHKTRIAVQYILINETKNDFFDYYDYWVNKVDDIFISTLNFQNNEIEGFKSHKSIEHLKMRNCGSFSKDWTLDAKGRILPCCGDYSKSLVVGNIKKQLPEEIMKSDEYIKAKRALTQESDFTSLPEICKSCEEITEKHKAAYVNCSWFKEFDMDKIKLLKGTPLVLYGANHLLLGFITKIKLFDDINAYDFVIVDKYKDEIPCPPLCVDEYEASKYKVYEPSIDIMSNKRIIVFATIRYSEVCMELNEIDLSCEPHIDFISG